MENNNAKIIADLLAQAMAESAPDRIISLLNNFIKALDEYLKQLDFFYNNLFETEKIKSLINQYETLNANKATINYAIYKEGLNKENDIKELLKEGYLLIDLIRQKITNETIQYRIGTEKNNKLYERIIGIEEILNSVKIDYNYKAALNNLYKLRLDISKTSIIDNNIGVEEITEEGSTLYSSIRRYIDLHPSKRKNRGNEYEVYRLLYSQRGNTNLIPPKVDTSTIAAAFAAVRKNTASYSKGGDLGLEQIKYIGNTMPSLTSTASIRTTLEKIKEIFGNYLESANSNELENSLKKVFLKELDPISEKIEIEAKEKAEKFITEVVAQLKIK